MRTSPRGFAARPDMKRKRAATQPVDVSKLLSRTIAAIPGTRASITLYGPTEADLDRQESELAEARWTGSISK